MSGQLHATKKILRMHKANLGALWPAFTLRGSGVDILVDWAELKLESE
jgi:hypothetical protein